ncbi:uncharacterized protein LOC123473663 [Daphnia magna]|uniref:uncharacterized protein LOC123473663 n=1 Tax=Daphnia magna TaxID=35525 RepID=UPI001E1BCA3E|nr:uncharacterized protein LOC123473663 [Daphnia magna]
MGDSNVSNLIPQTINLFKLSDYANGLVSNNLIDVCHIWSGKRVVNIGIGFDTDSSAVSDTQYRYTIGASFKNRYRKTIGRVSIDSRYRYFVCKPFFVYPPNYCSLQCQLAFSFVKVVLNFVAQLLKYSYLYKCKKCALNALNKDSKESLLSCSDISRNNLKQHLKSRHPCLVDAFEEACKKGGKGVKRNAICMDEPDASGSLSQPTIRDSISGKRPNISITQSQFDEQLLDYMVGSLLPIRHVDSKELKTFCNGISHGNFKIMCRQTIAKKIEDRFQASKQALAQILSKLTSICTTADVWKSRGRSYMGVTCHWLDTETLLRKSACLAVRRVFGSHTYDVVAKTLSAVHKEFKISRKIVVTITDSGSNFPKTFRVFSRENDVQVDEDVDEEYEDEEIVSFFNYG